MIAIRAPWEVPMMRTSGRLLAEVIAIVRDNTKVGVTTLELDAIAEEEIRRRRARPAFKGYVVDGPPFPGSICASINEQIVHGIPNSKPLKDGDLVSLDFGLEHGGFFADSAFSVVVGEAAPRTQALLDATEASLYEAVSRAVPGARVGDIGHSVQSYIEAKGFNVVRALVGHGIGRSLHEAPSVPNYGKRGTGVLLKAGMCIAIEPMVTIGSYKTRTLKDRWTVVTQDRSLAAHFEHTVLITPQGPEILTKTN